MIKVGFVGNLSKSWMGGINYYKNLLFALNTLDSNEFDIFFFIGRNTDPEIKHMLSAYATVVEDELFDRGSLKWFMAKMEGVFFKKNIIYSNFFKKYDIQILSHSSLTRVKGIKTINWIPDFQHIHLPNMFSKKEIRQRNNFFKKIIIDSDRVLLSSFDALNDYNDFIQNYENKARVLQFVSQPDKDYWDLDESDKGKLLDLYKIPENFFYIPNQFWKHKNHLFVFKAIHELKKEGSEIFVVCSGCLSDYRDKKYIEEVQKFISSNNLHNNIILLGLIDYKDVFALMRFSKAVINPSLFEGWSSTVEECKSLNKNMILSDLNVHIEQYPSAVFFKRNNLNSLKAVLSNYNEKSNVFGIESIHDRTQKFAENYLCLCKELTLL